MEQIGNLLPLALQCNLVPAKQGCRQQKNTDLIQFEEALQVKKIWHSSEDEMKIALKYVFILVGLRAQNYPANEEKQLLHAFIFKNYGGHTPEEIKLAWDLAIMQKLDVPAKDVTCYENFSIAYFSRIMEAYRDWAKEQIKQLPAPVEKPRELMPMEKVDINLIWALKLLNEVNKFPTKI